MKKILMIFFITAALLAAFVYAAVSLYPSTAMVGRTVRPLGKRHQSAEYKNQWVTDRGHDYYYDENGAKSRGAAEIDGKQYVFDDRLNYMKRNYWENFGGQRRYFGEDGALVTGTLSIAGKTYYFDDEGNMAVGWIKRDGKMYYYDSDGSQVFGKKEIDGKVCWFDSDTGEYQELNVDISKPMVALTYDDGPSAHTDKILDILEKYHAKATFFQIGSQVSTYPETEKRIVSLDCELANHTWEHQWLSNLDRDGINYQLDHTSDTIESITGVRPTLMRPPGGFYNTAVQEEADMPMIYWSIDTKDWETKDAEKTVEAVLDHVKDGDIVLMHDLYKQTAEASETIIPKLIEKGYQLVTVSELARARNIELQDGHVYYSFYK